MGEARLVRPALGHQEMEVGVEIDLVSEGLDGRDDPGLLLEPAFVFRQETVEVMEQHPIRFSA